MLRIIFSIRVTDEKILIKPIMLKIVPSKIKLQIMLKPSSRPQHKQHFFPSSKSSSISLKLSNDLDKSSYHFTTSYFIGINFISIISMKVEKKPI